MSKLLLAATLKKAKIIANTCIVNNLSFSISICKSCVFTIPIFATMLIEEIVQDQLKKLLSEKNMVSLIAEKCGLDSAQVLSVFQKNFWSAVSPGEMNRLITLLVEKAVVWEDRLEIEFKTNEIKPLMKELKHANR